MTVLGRENLEGLARPFVLVSNHASHLDAPLIFGALPRKLARYVAASAAADYFFDVWWRKPLASLFFNAFPVDRTGPPRPAQRGDRPARRRRPAAALPRGRPLPDRRDGQLQTRRRGAVHQPGRAGVPVGIVGAAEAMPYGQNWPNRGRPPVYVTFGEPMWADDGETAVQFSERIAKEVRGLVDYAMTYRAEHG